MRRKVYLKNLARVVEWNTCLDINVCNLPQPIIRKMERMLRKRRKVFRKLEAEAFRRWLFVIPDSDYATNYDITDRGKDLVDRFYKPGVHERFKY